MITILLGRTLLDLSFFFRLWAGTWVSGSSFGAIWQSALLSPKSNLPWNWSSNFSDLTPNRWRLASNSLCCSWSIVCSWYSTYRSKRSTSFFKSWVNCCAFNGVSSFIYSEILSLQATFIIIFSNKNTQFYRIFLLFVS